MILRNSSPHEAVHGLDKLFLHSFSHLLRGSGRDTQSRNIRHLRKERTILLIRPCGNMPSPVKLRLEDLAIWIRIQSPLIPEDVWRRWSIATIPLSSSFLLACSYTNSTTPFGLFRNPSGIRMESRRSSLADYLMRSVV